MNIQEILNKKNIGKQFKDDNGETWVVCRELNFLDYPLTLNSKITGKNILDEKSLHEVVDLEFEKEIDWSKVPVDTKILVSSSRNGFYEHRHFARYDNGKVYAFREGKTSFTSDIEEFVVYWEFAKLYKEGEE